LIVHWDRQPAEDVIVFSSHSTPFHLEEIPWEFAVPGDACIRGSCLHENGPLFHGNLSGQLEMILMKDVPSMQAASIKQIEPLSDRYGDRCDRLFFLDVSSDRI